MFLEIPNQLMIVLLVKDLCTSIHQTLFAYFLFIEKELLVQQESVATWVNPSVVTVIIKNVLSEACNISHPRFIGTFCLV